MLHGMKLNPCFEVVVVAKQRTPKDNFQNLDPDKLQRIKGWINQ